MLQPSPQVSGIAKTYHSEVLEWSGLLDVLQGLCKVLQLQVDSALGLNSILDSLGLESLDGLDLATEIVGSWLEGLVVVLDLVDNSLVLKNGAVVGEVDLLWLLGKLNNAAAGLFVALLEGLEGGNGLATETETRGNSLPVELESCGTL
jgi:hypothetical protein